LNNRRLSGDHYFSSGPMVGTSRNRYFKLLGFISWTRTDIPEKQNQKRGREREKEAAQK
jgi:hypothetical protein